MRYIWFIANKIGFGKGARFTKFMLLLGILSVSLSIMVMVLTSAITNGFQNQITNKVYNFWGHIHISGGYLDEFFDSDPITLSSSIVDSIQNLDLTSEGAHGKVTNVNGIIQYPIIIQNSETLEGAILRAVDSTYRFDILEKYIVEGKLEMFKQESRSILLSTTICDRIDAEIGDKLILFFVKDNREIPRRFEIVGTYNTGLTEFDEEFVFLRHSDVAEILGFERNEYTSYEVTLDYPEDISIYDNYLYEEVIPSDLFNFSIEDQFDEIFNWVRLQEVNEKIIIGLLMLVCVINMITVFLILVMEKVQLVGIFKALGATDGQVKRIFIYLALRILVLGLIIGNLVALTLGYIQQKWKWIKLDETEYYLKAAPIEFSWQFIILINLLCLVVCLLFMFIPAMVVSKISPARTLRFS
ncbi:ABC transporter permease [Membranihabitans maritimus]|uniref:ABC transporter permease n=1 Tax=Membranihabitans maritimus TaxID=2904244 RepID=UPI001F0155AE|nr:FtsX-like permease family protein [Membranihabitans maritimus]